jgi:5'-deoxynucleotidase YfbR-like HD superfamily hydrolase
MSYATLLQNLIHALGTHRWHQHQQLGGTHETVGHHSAAVALIAHYLVATSTAEELVGVLGRYQVMRACLAHDLGEYWVGDVPSPTKRALGAETLDRLDTLEYAARIDKLHLGPWALRADQQVVVHLADCLAGSLHCVNQILLGNQYAARPLQEYTKYIEQYCAENPATAAQQVCEEATTMLESMKELLHARRS